MAKDRAHIAHRACTPVKKTQVAKDTALASQHTKRAHRNQVAKESAHTAHRSCTLVRRSQVAKNTAHTAHQACTTVNKSQAAKEDAPATQHAELAHR